MPRSDRWSDAKPACFWLDDLDRPESRPALEGAIDADLLVIGGGLTGLWAALQALERSPDRSVVVLEGDRIASNASGRNGGFCAASLTHGDPNGRTRWPDEMAQLRQLGEENLSQIDAAISRYAIDCNLEATGQLEVAVAPWQAEDLHEEYELLVSEGQECAYLEGEALEGEISSPLVTAGLMQPTGQVLLNPARLAWGLARAIESLGGTIFEHARVQRLESHDGGVRVTTTAGVAKGRNAIVATAAFPALVTRSKGRVVPVYDYVLMSEPLDEQQLAEIGWANRRGISDAGNQFHYLRLTADDRILFGGYEAVYRFNQKVDPIFDQDPHVFSQLEEHFDQMFPSLSSIGFSHRWGGAIDTSTRFAASVTMSHSSSVATVNGFTGLGVGASRFFAGAALDRLDGAVTPASSLQMVRRGSVPFPPEPIRFIGISATRRSIALADANEGKRNWWLRLLDSMGLGFDS
jgi:glycine/D-amino acid oxidase-like deaminating enzyme